MGFYTQSIKGHFELMGRAEPISDVLKREDSSSKLRTALQLAVTVRDFASTELGLPDNGSYRQYVDLQRDQVVWLVVATPEFSIEPIQSCFLVVGCVSYRGYFAKEDADAYTAELKLQGVESYIGKSSAYSTLGWFNDPLLNTIVKEGELRMVDVIFHELAHQQLYLNDESTFNESFATAVAQIGSKRWFERQGEEQKYRRHLQLSEQSLAFNRLLINRRKALATLYQSNLSPDSMRIEKQKQFSQLQSDYLDFKREWNGDNRYDLWMSQALNNAHLALSATYQMYTPAFIKLFEENGQNFTDFYLAAKKLSELSKTERKREILALLKRAETQ
jgi:predicted aminopeptidase